MRAPLQMLYRLVAAVMPLIPLATGCTSVATVRRPAQFIASKAPRVVWVTTADNGQVALLSPRVSADTLGGLAGGVHYVEMPLSNVRSMRARQPAPRRTLLLVGGLTLGVAVLAQTVGRGAGSSPTVCLDPADPLLCRTGTSGYPP
jgi:hypothetical protein